MPIYKDSLGNVYTSVPSRPPVHKAKPTTETSLRRSSRRKSKSNAKANKHARYRANRGRPNGPGMPGNKSGRNKLKLVN
jgi:hypothetical protein